MMDHSVLNVELETHAPHQREKKKSNLKRKKERKKEREKERKVIALYIRCLSSAFKKWERRRKEEEKRKKRKRRE